MKRLFQLGLAFALCAGLSALAQREREIPPLDTSDYGGKFFDQLRSIFGRFRDADLRRVFERARPIQCSDLVTDQGEWREVAFFNENRKLGDWYRTSIDEVRSDLAVYIFKGGCGGQRASVQVTTEFPVEESYNAYRDGRIRFRNIDVNVNAPVTARFDSQSQAYVFDLPYLFRVRRADGDQVYTLNPRTLSDRYVPGLTNRWECKSVVAEDVTYQFLICNTTLVRTNAPAGNRNSAPSFGASGYSILSDGKEASSSVKLTYGDETSPKVETAETHPVEQGPSRSWRPVPPEARLVEVSQAEFRLRFDADLWKGKISQPAVITGGAVESGAAPRNKDYCTWQPRARAETSQLLDPSKTESIIYTMGFRKELQSEISASIEMQSDAGGGLGTLQCFFLKTQTPSDITVGQWLAAAGSAVSLEVPNH
jgi:hypothetical protein